MARYPVTVPISPKLVKKLSQPIAHEIARKIGRYMNEQVKDAPGISLTYGEISAELGISKEIVREFLFPVDGGSNGITILNPKAKEET